jgi:hypothetical protein
MVLDLINPSYKFSLYPNLLTVDKPVANLDINELVEIIRYGYLKEIISTLRATHSKDNYNQLKKEAILCVTLSGVFNYRSAKGLIKHSGLIQIDIDKVEDYDALFQRLCTDNYIYVCFRSPGGQGLKAVVKINTSPDTHKSQFKALEHYFKDKYGISIDSQCKDIARSMLLSFDPNIYCNPWSAIYEEIYVPEVQPMKRTPKSSRIRDFGDYENTEEAIDKMERLINECERRHIDLTSTYDKWIKIGFALCTTFGENGRSYYHRIGRMYPRYTRKETDKTFTQLLSKNNGRTKLATIIYLAKEQGIRISSQ